MKTKEIRTEKVENEKMVAGSENVTPRIVKQYGFEWLTEMRNIFSGFKEFVTIGGDFV